MVLSNDRYMLYVMRQSTVVQELRTGRIQRVGLVALNVYDENNELQTDLSGDRIRSWCIFDPFGVPIDGDIEPQDLPKFFVASPH